ncbi:MAG: SusC/RagA family TonB-linked outer membrane protein [Bacteroidales bacterium]|nr:SusC/RagA family TonB-linked outer membrane protein [Bacteroidales bacterium]
MRFNNILYQKIRFAGLFILVILLSCPVNAQVQKEKKVRQLFDVVLKVVDESGTPIPDAKVVVGEGITHAQTDANGSVSFRGYPEDVVTITALLFEKNVSPVIDLVQSKTVTLIHAKIHMTSDDNVPLPFTTLKRRNLTGPEVVIPGSYFARYPSTDLRNSLSGISSMYDVRELDGSPGLSALEGLQNYSGLSNSYGSTDKFGNAPYVIVDNIPADLQEYIIDPSEIESITLMKGILGTTMYGPAATGGVLYIKTKQGARNERMLHLDIENGVSVVDRMPGYVSGADYARLQNQARMNDGLPEIYTSDAIAGYANKDGYDLRYPSADYANLMLDKTKEFRRINLSSSGGNDIVQYNSYLGYAGEGDIIDMGSKSDYNRITTRQNLNVKINDQFTAMLGFYGNLSFRRSPNYGYDPQYTSEGTDNATLNLIELPSILNDIHNVPAISYPIWAYYDSTSNTPWYGVSALYTDNLIGNLVDQGFYTDRGRTGASNLTLLYDADKFIKGLKSTTFFGFNIHNTVRIGKTNDYLAYTVNPTTLALTKFAGHSLIKQADLLKLMDYYFQRYAFYEELSYNRSFASSNLQSTLTYNQVMTYINGIEEPQRQRNTVLSLMYSIKDKYSFHGVLNYAGNSSFDKDYRNILNWAVGGNYVISDESFMSNIGFLNYLKLRIQGGVAGNETYFPNLYYVDRWSTTSSTSTTTPWGFGPLTSSPTWFGTTRDDAVLRSYLSRTGNPIITWEKREEINAGFDAVLFDNKVTLGMTYYNWLVDGSISQVSNVLPLLAGYNGARPYYNYNQTRYNALGADLTYTQKVGEVVVTVGANATTAKGMRVKYDEPNYRFDYLVRTGKESDAIFGFKYLDKFNTDAEAQGGGNTPIQMFDDQNFKGDLKYQDMNEDGVVDDLDQTVIGHSSPRLYYGVNISLKYKNFDLFILGVGRAFYDLTLTNPYFWNGWQDNNYSNFVKDNIGGAYPRLTYNRVNNNFVTSDFWLTKGDYFKIQNVELAYTIPSKMLQFMGGRAIRLYVRGSNLLTLSKIKDVDPESINSGVSVYPLFKTFSGGVKFNF